MHKNPPFTRHHQRALTQIFVSQRTTAMDSNSSSNSQETPPNSKPSKTPQHKAAKPSTHVAVRTPDLPPPRLRNRRAALSLKDVRRAAQSAPRDLPNRSARRQINLPDDVISASASSAAATASTLKPKARSEAAKIPEKYQNLVEFFNCLDSSIRLLRIRGSRSTFSNIAPQIQSLTNRRFSYEHLAQIKCIIPEAIALKRVLLFDERTCCMKPDLLITIDGKAIECDENLKPESKTADMRRVFRARISKFYEEHPQGDDIPQAVLPEPFNRKQSPCPDITEATSSSLRIDTPIDVQANQSAVSLSAEPSARVDNQSALASRLSRSFRRSFSARLAKTDAKVATQNPTQNRLQESVSPLPEPCHSKVSCTDETISCAPSNAGVSSETNKGEKCSAHGASSVVAPKPCLPATPSKNIPAAAEVFSTPLLSTTPGLLHPKRCYMSPDNDSASSPTPTKSLKFDTPVKSTGDRQSDIVDVPEDDDISNIFSEKLLKSIQEKEEKAKEERDPAISQAKRRKLMISRLPKLFNTIHFLFQSKKQSVITKNELIHKITADRLDFADTREIEEQLNLLLELVPEWISEKLTSSSDLLLRINKMSSPETIRARLEGAK